MKVLAYATGAVVVLVVLVSLAAGATGTAPPLATCAPPDGAELTAAVTTALAREDGDKPASALASAGITQPATQLPNALHIIATGAKLGAPQRAQAIAVATAMQETRLRNLANPAVPESLRLPNEGIGQDHDSIGLFQQRPSTGWGTPAQLMDPTYATTAFYTRLLALAGWETMALTDAAQAIQRSAFPLAYARWEHLATAIVAATGGGRPCQPPLGGDVLIVGSYALPVPISAIQDPAQLTSPHHDYPAWDLGLPERTPIYAPTTGTIIAITTSGACGWGIVLQDPDGYQWNLCHGTPNTITVTTGQTVTAGTPVFLSGNTGNSTGPHIHLGIRSPTGARLCPQPWLFGIWSRQLQPIADLPSNGCYF